MTSPPSPPNRRRRRILVALAAVVIVTTISWWIWPLETIDQRFIGTWRCSPRDGLESICELRSDGLTESFIAWTDHLGGVAVQHLTRWQIRGKRFQIVEHDKTLRDLVVRVFSDRRRRATYLDAEIVSVTEDAFVLSDGYDGRYRLMRVSE